MNKVLKEEIEVRKWIQTILIEDAIKSNPDLMVDYLMVEGGFTVPPDELYRVFIQPFADVVGAAKVGTKDLLSIARLNLELLLTLSPSKMEKALQRYEKRTDAINKEWDETMKSTYEVMQGGDAALVGFMLNPAGFMGAKLAAKVPGAAVDTIDYLEDAGWGIPVVGGLVGSGGRSEDKKKEKDGVVDVLGSAKKLLGDLTKLFFIAHHAPAGPLISEKKEQEQEDEKSAEKSGSKDVAAGVQEYMDKVPGLEDNIKGHAAELIAGKEEQVNEIMGLFNAQIEMLEGLYAARDLSALADIMNKAQAAGVDLGGSGLSQFEAGINKSVENILADPEARQEYVRAHLEAKGEKVPSEKELEAAKKDKEKSGDAPPKEGQQPDQLPEVPDEKLKPEIEKAVFMTATQDLQTQIYTGVQKMKEQVSEELKKGMPPEEDWELIKQSSDGSTFITMVTDALDKVKAA